jgi:hypothetical protein
MSPFDGARISNAGPDVLEDVTIFGARISNAGWFPPLSPFPSKGGVMGVGGRQLGPGCATKTL